MRWILFVEHGKLAAWTELEDAGHAMGYAVDLSRRQYWQVRIRTVKDSGHYYLDLFPLRDDEEIGFDYPREVIGHKWAEEVVLLPDNLPGVPIDLRHAGEAWAKLFVSTKDTDALGAAIKAYRATAAWLGVKE